jgi:hypothetical protein
MKWIKANDTPPVNTLVHIRYNVAGKVFKTTGFCEAGKWYRQTGTEMDDCPNIEWLDETESLDMPTEQELKDEAANLYPTGMRALKNDKIQAEAQQEAFLEGRRKNIARIRELEAEQLKKYKWIAEMVLRTRDALLFSNYDEAYHWLYKIADPDCSKLEPWKEFEEMTEYKPHNLNQ